jgi:hypothetical protein
MKRMNLKVEYGYWYFMARRKCPRNNSYINNSRTNHIRKPNPNATIKALSI